MLIRMPTSEYYALKVPKEQEYLPKLSQYLSVKIPSPIKEGVPSEIFPYPFYIYKWIPGDSANELHLETHDLNHIAKQLASFLKELQSINISGPPPGRHNGWGGDHVSVKNDNTRKQIKELSEIIDSNKAIMLWEQACKTKWKKPLVWIHGDFSAGNIILEGNNLTAVIDFGGTAMGDPAMDLQIAWFFLDVDSRKIFRDEMNIDDETWLRGRAWALWKATFDLCEITDKQSSKALRIIKTIHDILGEV